MEYITNPRRAPRVPVRLRVEVLHRGVDFVAETEDVGPKGCLVASPRPLDPGAWVRLMLQSDRLSQKLRVTGKVAWALQPKRQRAGVAFAETKAEPDQDPFVWFDRLMRATPGLVPPPRHVPDRLPYDAPLFLLPPPSLALELSNAELRLIAGMRNGATVEDLLGRLEPQRKNHGRIIFALLTRRVLSLSSRGACHPSLWRPLLVRAGALSGLEIDGEPEEVVRLADLAIDVDAPTARGAGREILPSWLTRPSAGWTEAADSRVIEPPPALEAGAPAAPAPARSGAAATPEVPSPRSPQAERHYQQGLAAAAAGNVHGAIQLLRQALALSPDDPEISNALGQLAFKDRLVPER